jgi:hypothetical protein
LPSLCRKCVCEKAEVDEIECPDELVRKWLGDVLLKKLYLPDLGPICFREFGCGDVASENLNIIAIADAGQRHEIKCPHASPSTDVYDPRDMSDIDSRRDELRIVK